MMPIVSHFPRIIAGSLCFAAFATHSPAQDGIGFGGSDGSVRGALRPSMELGFWAQDGDNSNSTWAILPDDAFFQPRLSLALDAAVGDEVFFAALGRVDRGFFLGDKPDGDFRLDEVMLRWRPLQDERINLQIGKFPTVFGSWVAQHDFYDDPFILPPVPYSQIIGVNVRNEAALSPASIESRRGNIAGLDKRNWAAPIWGPVYATGASLFGAVDRIDYAVELKSAGLSSTPGQWEDQAVDFSSPSVAGRLGWRPDASMAFGISAARGEYVPGQNLAQNTVGLDARWSAGFWIVNGEIVGSEYETRSGADLRTLAWHLGVTWKMAPGISLSGRIGGLHANDTKGPDGNDIPWTPDIFRSELAVGWRVNDHLTLKASYANTVSDDPGVGKHFFGLGLGWQW